jgi:hypothetical protein
MKPISYLELIEKKLGYQRKQVNAFWFVCPLNEAELKKNSRDKQRVYWRHVAMVWFRLCGETCQEVGNYFEKDHSTVVYAEKVIYNALCGYNKELKDIFDSMIKLDNSQAIVLNDIEHNHINCLVSLENFKFLNSPRC